MTAAVLIEGISLGLLVTALILSVVRLALGPTVLDRAIAVDVGAASIVAIVAIVIVLRDREDLGALLIVFVLTAFFSTVTVARFAVGPGRRSRSHRRPVRGQEQEGAVADGKASGAPTAPIDERERTEG